MQKSVLPRALQQEIRRHDFSCFVDQPPSVAQGGKGVVVPGCPTCKKRINTLSRGVVPRPRFLAALRVAGLHLPVL
jgi:hypothetical protein